VIMFVWKFAIPLTIYVVAFSKILGVIRRQAKVTSTNRRKATVKSFDASTVAPTMTTVIGSTLDTSQREMEVGSRGQRQAESQRVSQTEINVIKTMMFIIICFTLCWMPMTFDLLYLKVMVRKLNDFWIDCCTIHKS